MPVSILSSYISFIYLFIHFSFNNYFIHYSFSSVEYSSFLFIWYNVLIYYEFNLRHMSVSVSSNLSDHPHSTLDSNYEIRFKYFPFGSKSLIQFYVLKNYLHFKIILKSNLIDWYIRRNLCSLVPLQWIRSVRWRIHQTKPSSRFNSSVCSGPAFSPAAGFIPRYHILW